ncbi:MAG: CHAT domain-containing protein [Myxococcota bacterium]|nr:CHAT domain-containing protein [Myxococcota bacterium]
MNVTEVELLKAGAFDALHRGQLPEARQSYQQLLAIYQRYPFLQDAPLALHFNALLTCLGQQQTLDEADEHLRIIVGRLELLEAPTPMSRQLGERLLQLFRFPTSGLEAALVERAIRLAIAQRVSAQPLDDIQLVLDESPTPEAFTQLNPEDMLLFLFLCVRHGQQIDRLPSWLQQLHLQWLRSEPLPEEVKEQLRLYQQQRERGATIDAYRTLLELFEWACQSSPLYACEWLIGLKEFEEEEEAERLQLLPRFPYERRLYSTLSLYLKLARYFSDEGGAEKIALVLWQEIHARASELQLLTAERKSKGKGVADDSEKIALLCLYVAESLRAQGALTDAYDALASPLKIAQRNAFSEPVIGARVFAAAGDLAERRYDEMSARDHYLAALSLLSPKFLQSPGKSVSESAQQLREQGRLESLPLLVKIVCALTRLGVDRAEVQLGSLRLLTVTLRPELKPEIYAEALLYLELSACRLGDQNAAPRALEVARALQHRSGVALSLFYSILRELQQLRDDDARSPDELQRLSTVLWRYGSEARRAGGGEIQRQVALASLLIKLDNAKHNDSGDLESRLASLQKLASGGLFNRRSSALDLFLPRRQALNLEEWIETLTKTRSGQLVHRLCVILRDLDRHHIHITPRRRPAAQIQQVHRHRFQQLWCEGKTPPVELFRAYDQLLQRPDTASWRHRQISPGEFRLEYKVFDQRLITFLISAESVQVHQQDIFATNLRARVSELCALLRPGGEDHLLLREVSIELYRLLIEPFKHSISQAHRLMITPDGPLWELPFALLRDRDLYLAQRFDLALACPTGEPAFATHQYEREQPLAALISSGLLHEQVSEEFAPLLGEAGYQQLSVLKSEELLELAHEEQHTLHTVYLPGELVDGRLCAEGQALGVDEIIFALARLNSCCAMLPGPHSGEATQRFLRMLLTSVQGGLLVRRWVNEPQQSSQRGFLFDFFSRAFSATSSIGLIEALSYARRSAIESRIPPQYWACFELYLSERS